MILEILILLKTNLEWQEACLLLTFRNIKKRKKLDLPLFLRERSNYCNLKLMKKVNYRRITIVSGIFLTDKHFKKMQK